MKHFKDDQGLRHMESVRLSTGDSINLYEDSGYPIALRTPEGSYGLDRDQAMILKNQLEFLLDSSDPVETRLRALESKVAELLQVKDQERPSFSKELKTIIIPKDLRDNSGRYNLTALLVATGLVKNQDAALQLIRAGVVFLNDLNLRQASQESEIPIMKATELDGKYLTVGGNMVKLKMEELQ